MLCESRKVLFLPSLWDMNVIAGMTRKLVASAETEPNIAGQDPAAAASPLNR